MLMVENQISRRERKKERKKERRKKIMKRRKKLSGTIEMKHQKKPKQYVYPIRRKGYLDKAKQQRKRKKNK